jgi:hypothetical protein
VEDEKEEERSLGRGVDTEEGEGEGDGDGRGEGEKGEESEAVVEGTEALRVKSLLVVNEIGREDGADSIGEPRNGRGETRGGGDVRVGVVGGLDES